MLACVDSGADRTFLPLGIAGQLGIADNELTQDPHGGRGVGSSFSTWSSTVPIFGRILAILGTPAQPRPELWGPQFLLSPAFSENDDCLLLGRQDFFRAFTVTFQEQASGPVFHVDYPDAPAPPPAP